MLKNINASDTSNNINRDFVSAMIPYTEGLIELSNNLLKFGICSELKTLTEEIINTANKQLTVMLMLVKQL